MKKMKKAFTLAEVLITLTIIGIVSALTIPVLVQKTNKQEYVSALQKAYSVLSQTTQRIIAEEGSPKGDDGGWASSNENVYNLFKKYLNNVKDCGPDTGCFEQLKNDNNYKTLDTGTFDKTWITSSSKYKLILADGTQLVFIDTKPECPNGADWGSKNICAIIAADINGEKKPNQIGRDLFYFVLKENGLFPRGCDDDYCLGTQGYGCACKVLREGKMDY